jgi:hypothetical protein
LVELVEHDMTMSQSCISSCSLHQLHTLIRHLWYRLIGWALWFVVPMFSTTLVNDPGEHLPIDSWDEFIIRLQETYMVPLGVVIIPCVPVTVVHPWWCLVALEPVVRVLETERVHVVTGNEFILPMLVEGIHTSPNSHS